MSYAIEPCATPRIPRTLKSLGAPAVELSVEPRVKESCEAVSGSRVHVIRRRLAQVWVDLKFAEVLTDGAL